ncbi:hypothetical protein BGI41_05895 [Methanobrevibacter sp. 87.7]|uniref:hypothetical protein n=1 Tax=Methanobrevibacter sp. 87.7 TaxID=387957 RepID=UPI000B506166|nr:hypothetical protein [Methanobrevibacter sp. 87.7]OWT32775.1 hypothetical protein BGI41_05895 [Methanobrevibacter sp. 87.7]
MIMQYFRKNFLLVLLLGLILLIAIPSAFATSVDSNLTSSSSSNVVLESNISHVESNINSPNIDINESHVESSVNSPNINIDDSLDVNDNKILNSNNSINSDNSNLVVKNNLLKDSSNGIIYVSLNGSDTNGDGSLDNPYATIKYALTKVNNTCNVIKLFNGVYTEYGFNLNNDVSIIGESQNGTIIDGNKTNSIFVVNSNLVLKSLTLRNANSRIYGAAVIVKSGATLNVDNCSFINNTASGSAGIDNSGTVLVNNSYFEGNTASSHDGGAVSGVSESFTTILNSVFVNNTAYRDGGAIKADNSTLLIVGSKFVNNIASGYADTLGGAVYVYGADAKVYNSSFIGNSVVNGTGAAIYAESSYFSQAFLDVSNCVAVNNSVNNDYDYPDYSAVFDYVYAYGNLTYSLISDNKAPYALANASSVLNIDYNWWGNTQDNKTFDSNLLYDISDPNYWLILRIKY